MRHSLVPAFLAAALMLACASSIASEEIIAESVKPHPDSAPFQRLCEELMSHVLQHSNVEFAQASADLGTNTRGTLDEIVEIAFDCPSLTITVTGHTDSTENEAVHIELGKARAESVVAYLTKRGIDPERLRASDVGSDTPLARNDNATGLHINRLIEFSLDNKDTYSRADPVSGPGYVP